MINIFRKNKYDFLDLGSKYGGSILYCEEVFHAHKGLGVDMRPRVVKEAHKRGFDVIEADILEYEPTQKFRFVSMLDFLEHLNSKDDALSILEKSRELASDFLFIRHPSFEDQHYLAELGLKFTWHDWKDHTNPLLISDFAEIFDQLGLNQYAIRYRMPIDNSNSKFVVPLSAPQDTLEYDKVKHGDKQKIKFSRTLFGQLDIFVATRKLDFGYWNKITNATRPQD